jgi:hypothetical protein
VHFSQRVDLDFEIAPLFNFDNKHRLFFFIHASSSEWIVDMDFYIDCFAEHLQVVLLG